MEKQDEISAVETTVSERKNINVKMIIGVAIAAMLFAAIYFFLPTRDDDLTATEIYEAMMENEDINERIDSYAHYASKRQDPNGILGDEGTYISKTSFRDVDTSLDEDDEYDITIEVFRNEKDLEFRIDQLTMATDTMLEEYPEEEYGDLFIKMINWQNDYHMIQEGNALFRIHKNYSKNVVDMYVEAFTASLENMTYSQEDVPSEEELEERRNDKYDEYVDHWQGYRDATHELLDGLRDEMNKQVDSLLESLDENQFEIFKTDVDALDIGYFKDDIEGWRNSITEIQDKIDENNAILAAEKERKDTLAANRHSAGMYKVGEDIPAGEYVLIGSGYFEITSDSSGTLQSIIANDNFTNNSIITVSEGQYLKVNRASFYSFDLHPDLDTTKEGMFKVGVHIPAGEYKIESTTSSGYFEVTNSSLHTLGSIVTNDFFTGGDRYVTLREGQYIKLSRARLVQ